MRSTADLRKLGVVAAAVVATAGLTISIGPTSAAAEPSIAGCKVFTTGPQFDQVRATVSGGHFRVCGPDDIVDLPVGITRNGRVVARGEGIAVYHCKGTAVGEFRVNAGPLVPLPCG